MSYQTRYKCTECNNDVVLLEGNPKTSVVCVKCNVYMYFDKVEHFPLLNITEKRKAGLTALDLLKDAENKIRQEYPCPDFCSETGET